MKDANTKVPIAWDDNPIDVSSEVNFIWGMATLLHAVSYKDADHRDVILPMTVLRRLECAPASSKDKVVKYAELEPSAKIWSEIAALEGEIAMELKVLKGAL
ncbi:MAG: hypothetical protein IJR99_01615 [Kiritimatiellae bacterium]|nr:hypothetical protein [Kiritimatiellia bacterium]